MLFVALGVGAILAVWAMCKVIVYALPCLLGLGVASVAISAGAGWFDAALTGLAAAVSSFFLLRLILAKVRSKTLRSVIAVVFALPTVILAYNIGIDALASSVPTELWRQGLSMVFAFVAGATAFVRLTEFEAADQ
jgi:hypothetical protein